MMHCIPQRQYRRMLEKLTELGNSPVSLRIEALRAAAQVVGNMPTDYIERLDYEKATVGAAIAFEHWLKTGEELPG